VGDVAAGLVMFVVGMAGALNWRGYLVRFMVWITPPEAPVSWVPWWRNYDQTREAVLMARWFRLILGFFGLCGAVLFVGALWRRLSGT
jgi:hypothetical protein